MASKHPYEVKTFTKNGCFERRHSCRTYTDAVRTACGDSKGCHVCLVVDEQKRVRVVYVDGRVVSEVGD